MRELHGREDNENKIKVKASYTPLICCGTLFGVLVILNLYNSSRITSSTCSVSMPPSAPQEKNTDGNDKYKSGCDYSNGKWIKHESGPLYNGSCEWMKTKYNCLQNGRPDKEYINWRWKPDGCDLPRFDPYIFLQINTNKHIAFVGDSLAWNQLESLMCMISSFSPPKLLHQVNGIMERFVFRRWVVESQFNVTISGYWSPFLVKGYERHDAFTHSKIFVDHVNDFWLSDYHLFDTVIITIGRWYMLPAVFYTGEKDDIVLGCHYCMDLKRNYTEVEVSHVYRRILGNSLKAIVEKMKTNARKGNHVIVNSYLPTHYDGEWDRNGTCSSTLPYDDGVKDMDALDAIMMEASREVVEPFSHEVSRIGSFRLELMDIMKLSWLRSDAHPGAYMKPFPFANRSSQAVQYDCLHWCSPGAIDTWNEILLQLIKRWWVPSKRNA